MNKKKMYTMAGGLALVAAIGIGSTLAYFTDSEETHNTVSMGKVNVTLTEPNYKGDSDGIVRGVVPNQTIDKDPTVTVDGDSNPAFVRMKVDLAFDGASGDELAQLRDEINKNLNAGWYYNEDDQYYYYNVKLNPNENATVFNSVHIPSSWGNKFVGGNLKIDVTAEAIQADNIGNDVIKYDEENKIIDWNGIDSVDDYEKVNHN